MKKSIFAIQLVALMLIGVCTTACTQATASNKSPRFVKTSYRCNKCGCKGYQGYYHENGTYEGRCSNSDSHGHTCGHSPEHHGLRSW